MLVVMEDMLANLVDLTLEHGTYETRRATDRAELQRAMRSWKPQLSIVDLDHYGSLLTLLGGGIARGRMPLLGFTRKRDAGVKLAAFERGVDDIIEVPFTLDEIVARTFALMRRAHGIAMPIVAKVKFDRMEVDLMRQRVRLDGKSLALSPIQHALLYFLAANPGTTLGRDVILHSLWGAELDIESNVVDRHIRELRVKLGDDWRQPRYIETVAGKGYRFSGRTSERGAAARPGRSDGLDGAAKPARKDGPAE